MKPGFTRNRVLRYIEAHFAEFDHSPSVREIAGGLELSTATIHAHLVQLKKEGRIHYVPGFARTIRLKKAVA